MTEQMLAPPSSPRAPAAPSAPALAEVAPAVTGAPAILRHPVVLMGSVFAFAVFGLCYSMFQVATPQLIGMSAWVVPPLLILLAICVALFIEGRPRHS